MNTNLKSTFMKLKRTLLFLFVATLTLGFASCGSDDDDENENKNEFVYGEFKTKIASCIASLDGNNVNIGFVGEGVNMDISKEEISGNGYLLYINLYSKDKSMTGKYLVEKEDEELDKSFDEGAFMTINGLVTNPKPDFLNFQAGSEMTINKVGDEYEITLKGKGGDGDDDKHAVETTAYYKGKVQFMAAKN